MLSVILDTFQKKGGTSFKDSKGKEERKRRNFRPFSSISKTEACSPLLLTYRVFEITNHVTDVLRMLSSSVGPVVALTRLKFKVCRLLCHERESVLSGCVWVGGGFPGGKCLVKLLESTKVV